MECCCGDSDQPVAIVSEENRHCHVTGGRSSSVLGDERDEAEQCPGFNESSMEQQAVASLPALTHHSQLPQPRDGGDVRSSAPDLEEVSADEHSLPFSKEVIAFSLFGRIHPKCKRPWNESLSARIAEVRDCYKNIPPKLYFSPSSVSLEGIGVYAAEMLPQGTSLGPYIGHHLFRDQIDGEKHNEWLWEVYDNNSLAYFVDASDPKLSNYNWMNFIQCARNCTEQNLKLTQTDDSLYFVATRDIGVGEELLVWYDDVQYGVYMGVPTGFHKNRAPIIESAAMEPGVPQEHSISQTLASAYPVLAHTAIGAALPLSRTQEQRFYVHYMQQPPATGSGGHLSDSASTDDSGISLSLEHSGGGPTPPVGLTSSFDRVSNSSGSSTQLDVTSTTSKHQTESYHSQSHVQEVAIYQTTGEVYGGGRHMSVPSGGSPLSQHSLGGGTSCSPQWMGGATKGDLGGGDVWLKSSSVSLGGQLSLSGGARKQLLYGMFSRYEDGTRWQCEECKKLFSSQGSLRAHARIHTGERPYQCQYCCRTFCQASTLRSHERLHTGEKPYKCENCGRAFTQSAGLRSHLKTHRYDS